MATPRDAVTLEMLYAGLPAAGPVPSYQVVAPSSLPASARVLLVHDQHMTEVMGRAHHGPVKVQVLARKRQGQHYIRQIILRRPNDQAIVQGGLVRIHLNLLPDELAAAILREDTPLGRLLVEHQTLRRIDIREYLRLDPQPPLENWLGAMHGQPTYGRLGFLHVDGQPVIELFEVLAGASLLGMEQGAGASCPPP